MTQNIQKIFKNLKNIEPSVGLEEKILKNIAYKRKWQAQRRLILADVLTLFSAGSFVFVLVNFWGGIAKSEFWSLSKLMFSDTEAVATFWKDFLFSLLETFPAGHLAAILAPVFLLMVSLTIYFSNNHYNNYKNYNH
jgi:hypothetical protein